MEKAQRKLPQVAAFVNGPCDGCTLNVDMMKDKRIILTGDYGTPHAYVPTGEKNNQGFYVFSYEGLVTLCED